MPDTDKEVRRTGPAGVDPLGMGLQLVLFEGLPIAVTLSQPEGRPYARAGGAP
jgi:hypothetical protein